MFITSRNIKTAGACLIAMLLYLSSFSFAQERPTLLFQETWQQAESALGNPTSPHARADSYYLAGPEALTNPGLELRLYGYKAQDITVYEHEGRVDLWTGLAGSPVAIMLKSTDNYLDLSGLARLRAIVRTNNLHELHPVIKLADGTLAIGSQAIQTHGAFMSVEVAYDNQDWFLLDPNEVVVGSAIAEPDLSLIDEVGFANLASGGGHGNAGWSNISDVELYANAVPR
ncbi:MAG: hypothetical protein CMQ38_10070 [Gammaproteobacteria bacterium]|nr:hypothetical protein [Gammaproteobacteria bacterium]|tara:strand:- start:303 stop:989 length:687 start_codon:yes stop_codon:yes gene_type:complete